MSDRPLVSMITYCYNGERFVSEYFEHVMAQTYQNIELIFFNNGSEDRTAEIAEEYKLKLKNRGIKVQLIHYKENQCTCGLKQLGFELMHGEYFFGCDSDDYIDPTYIEEMEGYLESHPDKGIVYCQLRVTEEESGRVMSIMKMIPRTEPKAAFEDILLSRNINYTAISYMMSRKWFNIVNPDNRIYQSIYGENNQVQMPFLYNDLQGYIEKPLGQYTVRKDSYSGKLSQDYGKKVAAMKGQEEAIMATMNKIKPENRDYYNSLFLKRNRSDRYYAALMQNNKILAKECYDEFRQVDGITFRARAEWILYCCGLLKTAKKILGR